MSYSYDGSYDDFSFSIVRGDDEVFDCVARVPNAGATAPYTNSNSSRQSLVGWGEIYCTAKLSPQYEADASAVFQLTKANGGVLVTNAAQGEFQVIIEPEDYANLGYRPTQLWVDIQGEDADGKIHTLCTGMVKVNVETTRS